MANLASLLRDEFRRLARREIRAQLESLRRDNARLKRDAAVLKRQVAALERGVKRLVPQVVDLRKKTIDPEAEEVQKARIGPRLIAALRKRLGLSRGEFGKLVGVSENTVYQWETGKNAPRPEAKAALVELRSVGKREARQRLEEMA